MKNNSEICRNTKQIQRRLGQQHLSRQDNVLLKGQMLSKGKIIGRNEHEKSQKSTQGEGGTDIMSREKTKSAINTMRRRRGGQGQELMRLRGRWMMARGADTGREMRERLGYYQRLSCCGKYFACRHSYSSTTRTKRLFFGTIGEEQIERE